MKRAHQPPPGPPATAGLLIPPKVIDLGPLDAPQRHLLAVLARAARERAERGADAA